MCGALSSVGNTKDENSAAQGIPLQNTKVAWKAGGPKHQPLLNSHLSWLQNSYSPETASCECN